MTISPELKRVYATAPDDDYYVETLQLDHPNFTGGSIYITNQREGWTANVETGPIVAYQFVPFKAIPPKSGEENNITLDVALDNASRSLMDELETLATSPTDPITVTYRVYLASDTTTVQNNPPLKLDIMNVTATPLLISFSAGIVNLRGRPFPRFLYTLDYYPALRR